MGIVEPTGLSGVDTTTLYSAGSLILVIPVAPTLIVHPEGSSSIAAIKEAASVIAKVPPGVKSRAAKLIAVAELAAPETPGLHLE